MRDQLNTIFASPAADLEFAHITRLRSSDRYTTDGVPYLAAVAREI